MVDGDEFLENGNGESAADREVDTETEMKAETEPLPEPWLQDFYKSDDVNQLVSSFWDDLSSERFLVEHQKQMVKGLEKVHGDNGSTDKVSWANSHFPTVEAFKRTYIAILKSAAQEGLTTDLSNRYKQTQSQNQSSCESRGLPVDWAGPLDFDKRYVNKTGGKKNLAAQPAGSVHKAAKSTTSSAAPTSSGSSSSSSSSSSQKTFDPDDDGDDSLKALAGVNIRIPQGGQVLGYVRQGASCLLLVEQGQEGACRHRLEPQNALGLEKGDVDLAAEQRGMERKGGQWTYTAKDVKALKAVAWKDPSLLAENPLAAIVPRRTSRRDPYPWTKVLVQWQDDETSWESRTTLRRFYGKDTADALIYKRAGKAEAKYARAEGLPPVPLQDLTLPSDVPDTGSSIVGSTLSKGSKSNKGTRSRTTRSIRSRSQTTPPLTLGSQNESESEADTLFIPKKPASKTSGKVLYTQEQMLEALQLLEDRHAHSRRR